MPVVPSHRRSDHFAIVIGHEHEVGLNCELCGNGDFRAVPGRIVREGLGPQRFNAVKV
jgi:hypothetical protein